MTTSVPEAVPVYTPPAPAYIPPPPPVPPTPTVQLSRCLLCGALQSYAYAEQHLTWHKANGLHGWQCAALKSLAARLGGDPGTPIDACDCGLEKKEI